MAPIFWSHPVGRQIIGCLISPLSAAFIAFVYTLITHDDNGFQIFTRTTLSTLMAMLGYAFGLLTCATCCVMVKFIKKSALIQYILCGFFLGVAISMILIVAVFDLEDLIQTIGRSGMGEIIAIIGTLGLLGGMNSGIFWGVVRPDKLGKKASPP